MSQWFVRPQNRPAAALRVFCLPYAGVGASAFRGWADRFGTGVEVVYVQLPGRETRLRETPLATISELARPLAIEIESLADSPFVFFGHSFGAIVAFETARELRRRGAPLPRHLFVSASRAPHLPWPHPPVRQLDDATLLAEINQRYGGSVPRQVIESAELRELYTPSLRADFAALETYAHIPADPLECTVSAFAGSADPVVPPSAVDEWRRHTTGAFRLRIIEGGHLFLQSAQADLVAAVLEDLGPFAAAGFAGETPRGTHGMPCAPAHWSPR